MAKTCLLVTDRFEATADLLVAELRRRNVPCVRWNLDQYPVNCALAYRACNGDFGGKVTTESRSLDFDDVGSIWCRSFRPTGFPDDLGAADRKFAETESRRALDALMTIANCVWINHPLNQVRANSKPAQLFVARKVGLDIPSTLISNDPKEIRSFLAKLAGPAIFKSLSQSIELPPGQSLFTGLLTEKELANLDRIRLTPGIFQEFVEKAYEVRTTVVGPRIFSARIDSQANAATRVDWRHRPFDIDKPVQLPPEVEKKIHALMQALGLVYGAIDFIVTPEGRHVFLEINPAGQYMWVESSTGLQIGRAHV